MTALSTESSVSQLIEQAWIMRYARALDECDRLVKSLERTTHAKNWFSQLTAAGVESSDKSNSSPISGDWNELAQIVLLRASLDRAQGQLKQAQDTCQKLKNIADHMSQDLPAEWLMQQAINLVAEGQTHAALTVFLKVQNAAKASIMIQMISLLNAVICMDHLALDSAPMMQALHQLTTEHASVLDALPNIKDQILVLELRNVLRQGRFDSLSTSLEQHTDGPSQASYLRTFIARLPYVTSSGETTESWLPLLGHKHELWHRDFRIATILNGTGGTVSYDTSIPAYEIADRLYLWTWLWLTDPERMGFTSIVELLTFIGSHARSLSFTAEDRSLLYLSLQWLKLFDPYAAQKLDRLGGELGAKIPDPTVFPFFHYEAMLIQSIQADLNGEKSSPPRPMGTKHSIFEHATDASKHILAQRIAELRALRRVEMGESTQDQIVVYPSQGMVETLSTQERLLSSSQAIAIQMLRDQKSVSCREFCAKIFGHRYDEVIHYQKIATTLSRIRKTLEGRVELTMKDHMIHVNGDWSRVEVRESRFGAYLPHMYETWTKFIYSTQDVVEKNTSAYAGDLSEEERIVDLIKRHGAIGRQAIQDALGASRSSTHRVIQKLVGEGIIVQEGLAKGTRYRIKSEERT